MAKPLTDVNQAINAILGLVRPNRFSVEINLPCANWKPERIESVEFPAYADLPRFPGEIRPEDEDFIKDRIPGEDV
jgi:hypothetical protein